MPFFEHKGASQELQSVTRIKAVWMKHAKVFTASGTASREMHMDKKEMGKKLGAEIGQLAKRMNSKKSN